MTTLELIQYDYLKLVNTYVKINSNSTVNENRSYLYSIVNETPKLSGLFFTALEIRALSCHTSFIWKISFPQGFICIPFLRFLF